MKYKNYLNSFYKKPALGKVMTPSKWVGEVEYTEVTRITMTSGGGVGGSRWNLHVKRVPLTALATDKPVVVKARKEDGTFANMLVNPMYMVDAVDVTIATATLDTNNPNFGGVWKVSVLLEDGQTIDLVDTFENDQYIYY